MTDAELTISANYIRALASLPDATDRIALFLSGLLPSQSKSNEQPKPRDVSALLFFSPKKIDKMPKHFKTLFKTNKIHAHIRKKPEGVYEIRCQINYHCIQASSKNLATAKEKFIEKLHSVDLSIKPEKARNEYFVNYMEEWLATSKKPFVKEATYKDYVHTFSVYIAPHFKGKKLTEIKHFELQSFLTTFSDSGRNRTAQKIYQLLSAVFEYAVTDELITVSPMKKVKLTHYEQEHGIPFTRAEEKKFIADFLANPTIYNQAFVLILYTGIRRAELASLTIENGWIRLISAKQRKNCKEKAREMPVSPMLQRILPLIKIDKFADIAPALLTKHFKKICPKHHLHDLRHTFITRAQECGIRREIVSLWAGHKADSSITTLVYTHLDQNKEVQIEEMKKFDYQL